MSFRAAGSRLCRLRTRTDVMFPIRNTVPSRYPPLATWALIAVNCLVFLFEMSLSPSELELLLAQYALVPARYSGVIPLSSGGLTLDDYLPYLTNAFLHGGW